MRRSIFGHLLFGNFFLSPDDGGGSGGGNTPPNDDPPAEKIYTEAEHKEKVEAAIKGRLQKASRELAAKVKEAEASAARVAELEKEILDLRDLIAKGEGGKPDEKHKGEIELLTKKFEKQVAELEKKLDTEKNARLKAEDQQRLAERNRLLNEALSEAHCKDMKAGLRYFLPQIEWDENEKHWYFRTTSDNVVEIKEGVNEEMPDYWKPASIAGSGNGSGGSPRLAAKRTELDKAKKELEEATAKVKRSGPIDSLLVAVSMAQKKIKKLEMELVR